MITQDDLDDSNVSAGKIKEVSFIKYAQLSSVILCLSNLLIKLSHVPTLIALSGVCSVCQPLKFQTNF